MKKIIWSVLTLLVIINIGLFVKSINLSGEINTFEKETRRLHEQNIQLEKETSYYDSYQFAASQAASFGFVKKSTPLFLENLKYALKR
jgi:uncharacterized protein YxeA